MAKEEMIRFGSEMLPTFTEKGYQPILERLCSVIKDQDLQPIDLLQGKSIKPVSEGLETSFVKGFFKAYKMEKCEKLSLSSFLLMDRILVVAVTIIPLDDYEIPMLVLEWSETESIISILVDYIPLVDLVMRDGYREQYLDPLKEYWLKFKDLPGIEPNPFEWARQVLGPYSLFGNIPKDSKQNMEKCMELFQNYLEVWLTICRKAEPIQDNRTKDYIKVRKEKIRKIFLENDEGSQSMGQLIGTDLQELTALCLF